jgi:hypothetical protein
MLAHHMALSAIHLAIAAILLMHGAVAEAMCVVVASAIYASMPPSQH